MTTPVHEARWWDRVGEEVVCQLCPRYCRLSEGQAGFCYVRQNQGGRLVSQAYGTSTGFALDPIEKKPLSHFLPGTSVLSFGTAGCNLGCKFCQNWSISKARLTQTRTHRATAAQVVELARERGAPSIACTYNDPVIYAEWMDDVGAAAHDRGLRMVAVTAGYVTPEAQSEVFRNVDAANVDLKGFSERFYRKLTLSQLRPVLDFLVWLKTHTEVWLEITTLLIPDWNDDPAELTAQCRWIVDNLGPDVPLHFTAFHPDYKLTDKPRTPPATLTMARSIAQSAGIRYVYTGNVHDVDGQTTRCPGCQHPVIIRDWHQVLANHLTAGCCPKCGDAVAGIWR